MSHVTTIELTIKSLDALKAACKRLDLQFMEGQKTFKAFYGNQPCAHAIRIPGASYEVGILENPETGYSLSWDSFSTGGLTTKLGEKAGKLKQAYVVEQAKMTAKKAGYRVTEKRTLMDRLRGALGMKQVEGIRLSLRRY